METRYVIKCSEDYWWDKQIDSYHWKFTKSSQVGLNGIRKFETCRGSFICKNDMCTKYTTENVQNRIDFQKDFNAHTCKSCGFYVHREFCGCVKVTEFDRETNVLTVYHQGTHTCNPKPDVQDHINKAKEINMENAQHGKCTIKYSIVQHTKRISNRSHWLLYSNRPLHKSKRTCQFI